MAFPPNYVLPVCAKMGRNIGFKKNVNFSPEIDENSPKRTVTLALGTDVMILKVFLQKWRF
jgi:hypothetical protein